MEWVFAHETEVILFLLGLLAVVLILQRKKRKKLRKAYGGIYGLIRNILILSVFFCIYAVVVAAISGGTAWWWVVVGALMLVLRKGKVLLTAHGTAHAATEQEVREAGMLDSGQGLFLGHLLGGKKSFLGRIKGMFDNAISAKEACRAFFGKGGQAVRLQAINTVCFCPAGGGKSSALAVNFLRECEDSCVVIDLKGELASLTAEQREKMGHEIIILDPFKVVTS